MTLYHQERPGARPANNSVKHLTCGKITRFTIESAYALAQAESPPAVLPCAWCDGDFPATEFVWAGREIPVVQNA